MYKSPCPYGTPPLMKLLISEKVKLSHSDFQNLVVYSFLEESSLGAGSL
jgi:hypothetical protein